MLHNKARRMRSMARPSVQEDGTVDVDAISYTQIAMWLRCGEQYRQRYVLGKKEPPAVAMAEGIAQHAAMEADNREKLDHGKTLPTSQLTAIFAGHFDKTITEFEEACDSLKTTLDWGGEDRDAILLRGKKHLDKFAAEVTAKIEPESAEEPFIREVPAGEHGESFRLAGQVDFTTKSLVGDYKVSSRAKSDRDIREDLQLTLYSWVRKKHRVQFVNFVKAKDPWIQLIDHERTPNDWAWSLEVVSRVVKSIRAGHFPLVNTTQYIVPPWWCSADRCGYWADCKGKYENR